ncbi:MAG: hypothetical protein ACYDB5_10735 [bacterium]
MSDQELVLDLDIKGDEIHFHCKGYDKEFIALIGNIISGRSRRDDKDNKQEAELNYIGVAGDGDIAGAADGGETGGCCPSNKNKDNKDILSSFGFVNKTTLVNKTDNEVANSNNIEKPINDNNTKENIDLNNNVVVSKMEIADEKEAKRLKRLAKMKEWRETHKEERKEYDRKRLLNKKANANKKESVVVDKAVYKYHGGRGYVVNNKENIIKDIKNGFSLSQIKDKYNIGGTTYYRYKSKYGIVEKENQETKKSKLTAIDIDKAQESIYNNSLNEIKLSKNPNMAKWQESMVARGL